MTDMSWMPWVVGGVMVLSFLYMKVWPFVRTIIRAFRGPRFKSKSKLSVEQYKKLSIGSLYALQQGGYLNTLSLDIKDKLPTILGEWWGINNAHDARETLDDLCRKGYDYYFPFVYEAFLLDDENAQDDIFQQNMESQEDYEKAVGQLQNLKEVYEELIAYEVITSKEDIVRYGVIGWDAGRINFVARACCDMKYILEMEAWNYIDKAYELAHSSFTSWHDMAISYVIGRAIWGGTNAHNLGMKGMADDLLSNPKSPWVQIKW